MYLISHFNFITVILSFLTSSSSLFVVWTPCDAFSIHPMLSTSTGNRLLKLYTSVHPGYKYNHSSSSSSSSSLILNVIASNSFSSSTLVSDASNKVQMPIPLSLESGDISTSTTEALSSTTNTIVFIIGIIPFLWATYEFWSRIAVGASFGTGKDSIQIKPSRTIGKDNDSMKSRGRRVLGDDALYVAYLLFVIAIGSVGIAIYSVLSSSPPPPPPPPPLSS